MGAGIATLAARFLSLGLADLRGHIGIGVDEGAWIGTAFNAATMFIGPLTVYLGALLGTRRVLLVCSAVFAIVSACLPFAHSYSLLILLMAIAGLSSGTFYPLTLSFALLNIPLRYLALTLGLYATCIEGALNFAPSLYGFYRNHLSWEWMFWTSALATPLMAACVYYGIPASSRPRPSGPTPSFVGFLYASAGLALLFAALDQGQRLDWWRSSVFTALFTTGSFFLLCAVIRRLRRPNPLVDLPYSPQVEHARPGIRCICVPFLPARDGPGHSADAGRARIRRGSNWSRRVVDGDSGVVSRLLRSPPVEQRSRLPFADGKRVCGHGNRVPHERECDQRVDGRKLLPDRTPHGRGSVVRVRRPRRHNHPAVVLLRRSRLTIPRPDVLRVLPCCAALRRTGRSDGDGPLHRRTGEIALVPDRAPRSIG